MKKLPIRSLSSFPNLNVSCQGLGCMGMSEFYGPSSDEESLMTLNLAFNSGINLFDTANVYGLSAENEILLGKFLKQHDRSQLVVATKCGIVRDKNDPSKRGVNNTPQYIIDCCNESLARLQTDYIDLYYLHRINEVKPDGAPLEESMQAFAQLLNDNKIRHVGISEANPEQIERAHLALLNYTGGKHGLTAVQSEYSLMSRGIEVDGTIAMCRKYKIALVAYSPLSRQLLTGHLNVNDLAENDFRRNLPRFQGDNFEKNSEKISKLKEIATQKRCSIAQLSLAWVLSQGEDIVPIPGTKREKYLVENINASFIHLTQDELKEIDTICPPYSAFGERYAQPAMQAYGLKR